VPDGAKPGSDLLVQCGHSCIAKVRIPRNYQSGQNLCIKVPKATSNKNTNHRLVDLPPELNPGEEFVVMVGGLRVLLVCPVNYIPGQRLLFEVPSVKAKQYRIMLPPDQFGGDCANCTAKWAKMQLGDRWVLLPLPPNCRVGAKIRVESSTFKLTHSVIEPPKNVLPGRPFLASVSGQKLVLTVPEEPSCDKFLIHVPFDEVCGKNLSVVDDRPPVPTESCWRKLPIDVLAHTLDYLPVKQIRDYRLVDSQFASAGKVAFEMKLRRAGVAGASYQELTENAIAFAGQAERQQAENNRVLDYTLSVKAGQVMDFHYLPDGLIDGFPDNSVQRNVYDPNLPTRCAMFERPTSRFQEPVFLGFDLGIVGLSLNLWVSRYREELECHVEWLAPFSSTDTKQRAANILESLRELEKAGILMTRATYIPHTISIISDPSSFEYVTELLDAPLRTKYEQRLTGVGRDPGVAVGVNLRYTGLMLSVPKSDDYFEAIGAESTNNKILRHVQECKNKLLTM